MAQINPNDKKNRVNLLRIQLGGLFIVLQVAGYFLSIKLAAQLTHGLKHVNSNETQLIIYSIFILLSALLVIILALRPLSTVEHFFAARRGGILLSNNLFRKSIADKIIDDILERNIDKSERVPTKQQASSDIALAEHAFSLSPIGIIALDHNNKPVLANQLAFELLSVPDSDLALLSKKLGSLKYSQQTNLIKWVAESRAGKIHNRNTWGRVEAKSIQEGQEVRRIFDVIASYEKNDTQGIDTIIVIIDRTTDYEQENESLNMIAIAAHELRGPITVLRGLVDVFSTELGPTLPPDQQQLLQRMGISAKQLTNYINNILSIAHIDQDSFETTLKPEDWPKLLTQICTELNTLVLARGKKLQLSVANDLPMVLVDRVGIEHVISNLVDNSLKYTHDDGVIFIKSGLKDGMIETTVQDNGIGIPESIIGHLFTKFYRSHHSKKAITGSGIGLFLCKTIIEAHNGNIWVKSKEGEGTVIGFDIPLNQKVADNNQTGDNGTVNKDTHGWIENHTLYRR